MFIFAKFYMKIGILGTRGIPNAYGGFEQFAQYLSQGLVRRGHSVWVYNSSDHPYKEAQWNGVHIVHCTDWERHIGTAGQFIYDLNCLKDARRRDFDVLLQLGYTSNSVWYPIWPRQMLNVVNMDGLEWKRSKYGPLTRRFLKRAEGWAARRGDLLIADSIGIRDYLQREYQRPSVYIPYGAEVPEHYDPEILRRWGLEPDGYFLLMARMEPENNIEMIIRGWMKTVKDKPLVLIGNAGNAFGKHLTDTYSHEQLRFLGALPARALGRRNKPFPAGSNGLRCTHRRSRQCLQPGRAGRQRLLFCFAGRRKRDPHPAGHPRIGTTFQRKEYE
jgi:glycosyltransferase involved in cell wall biosynthesis